MDKLEQIFSMQSSLDEYIRFKRSLIGNNHFTAEEWIQKKCIALIDETVEVLNEVNYKWWKNPKPFNPDAVGEELIDILHFWVSMCLDAGLTPDRVFELYSRKNAENLARQDGKSRKTGYDPGEVNKTNITD